PVNGQSRFSGRAEPRLQPRLERPDLANQLVDPPPRPFHVPPSQVVDHVRIDDLVPQRRARPDVGNTRRQLRPQLAQQRAQPGLDTSHEAGDALPQPYRERRAGSATAGTVSGLTRVPWAPAAIRPRTFCSATAPPPITTARRPRRSRNTG